MHPIDLLEELARVRSEVVRLRALLRVERRRARLLEDAAAAPGEWVARERAALVRVATGLARELQAHQTAMRVADEARAMEER